MKYGVEVFCGREWGGLEAAEIMRRKQRLGEGRASLSEGGGGREQAYMKGENGGRAYLKGEGGRGGYI